MGVAVGVGVSVGRGAGVGVGMGVGGSFVVDGGVAVGAGVSVDGGVGVAVGVGVGSTACLATSVAALASMVATREASASRVARTPTSTVASMSGVGWGCSPRQAMSADQATVNSITSANLFMS